MLVYPTGDDASQNSIPSVSAMRNSIQKAMETIASETEKRALSGVYREPAADRSLTREAENTSSSRTQMAAAFSKALLCAPIAVGLAEIPHADDAFRHRHCETRS